MQRCRRGPQRHLADAALGGQRRRCGARNHEAVLRFLVRELAQLFEADPDGSLMQYKDYVCGGSGMFFATGVLEANFKPNLSLQDATKLAIQAVQAAIERDVASGNGIDVLTITKNGVQKVYEKAVNMSIQ